MATTFNHPRPVVPAFVRERNRTVRAFERALRNPSFDSLVEATHLVLALTRPLTPAEREQVNRYNRQVDAYNEALRAHREEANRAKQARRNAAEVAKVRAAACSVCTMTHAGEC